LEKKNAAFVTLKQEEIDAENLLIALKQKANAVDVGYGVEKLEQGGVNEPPGLVKDNPDFGGINDAIDWWDDDVVVIGHR
jgi:hypothetical protein